MITWRVLAKSLERHWIRNLKHFSKTFAQFYDSSMIHTTVLLSRGNEPTLHNLEPFTAGLIAKVDEMEVNNNLKPIENFFRNDLLNRRSHGFSLHPLFELCTQAACFYHPMYKSMPHSFKSGQSAAYNHSFEECLFILYLLAKSFIPRESSSSIVIPTDTNDTFE